MSDSRSCGRCIYYNSITNECGEELKCMRDVDEAKYTSYIEGKKQGRADGYSQAENDYHIQSEKDRQSSYDCGYQQGAREFAEWLISRSMLCDSLGQDISDCYDGDCNKAIENVLAEWQKGN